MPLNVKSTTITDRLKLLDEVGEFKKYPAKLLRSSATVKVNPDDFLKKDEFIIVSPYCNLPRNIYIYGKNTADQYEDNIYLNYWMTIFLKTIENGFINQDVFSKCTSKAELTIGLPYEYRRRAYKSTWKRENIIEFLSCLFDVKLEQANYQQQDWIDLMVA